MTETARTPQEGDVTADQDVLQTFEDWCRWYAEELAGSYNDVAHWREKELLDDPRIRDAWDAGRQAGIWWMRPRPQ